MFVPEKEISPDRVQRGLRTLILDAVASQLLGTLTGGAFMIAFALKLGASNMLIGLLAAVGPLTNLVQVPAVFLVEKVRRRKAITFTCALVSRSMWVLIAALPFLFTAGGTGVFLAALLVNGLLAATAGTAWNSWMRDFIPQQGLGAFASKRMRTAIAVSIPANLGAALFIDYWKKGFADIEIYGYSMLFLAGFLAGLVGTFFISRVPEPEMAPPAEKRGFLKTLGAPFSDVNFRNLVMFFGSWHFAVNLATPFFTVYMMRRLGYGLTFIICLSILSQLVSLVFLRIWGGFTDRFSNKSVLRVCGPLFMFSVLGWTFTTMPDAYVLTLPIIILLHVTMGIATSGVNLAAGNISLKLAPKGAATAYMATGSMVNSAAAALAPILGGKSVDFFSGRQLALNLTWISPLHELTVPTISIRQWDFFFLFAFIIGLYAIHRLAAVREEGEVDEDVVVRELVSEVRKEMRNFSSVGDVRTMLQFPVVAVRQMTVLNPVAVTKKVGKSVGSAVRRTLKRPKE